MTYYCETCGKLQAWRECSDCLALRVSVEALHAIVVRAMLPIEHVPLKLVRAVVNENKENKWRS